MAKLIVYYSRKGENYWAGDIKVIEKGNTERVAEFGQQDVGGGLFELETVRAYPEGYDECCDVALEEKNAGARPELVVLPDLTAYERAFLGFPVWLAYIPMPVYTAIEALDWEGKALRQFYCDPTDAFMHKDAGQPGRLRAGELTHVAGGPWR